MRRTVVFALLLSATGLIGCGGDGGGNAVTETTAARVWSAEEMRYLDAMASALPAAFGEGSASFSEDENRCMAGALLAVAGVDALKAAGVTPEVITQSVSDDAPAPLGEYTPSSEQARSMVAGMLGCIDLGAVMQQSAASDPSFGLTADQAQCIGDTIESDPSAHVDAMFSIFNISPETESDGSDFLGILDQCGVDFGS